MNFSVKFLVQTLLLASTALAIPKEHENIEAQAQDQKRQITTPLNEVSVLRVLETAVPASLLNLALTNSLSAIAEVKSEFSAGHTPPWFSALPYPIRTYLDPYATSSAAASASAITSTAGQTTTKAAAASGSTPATVVSVTTTAAAAGTSVGLGSEPVSTRLVVVTVTAKPSSSTYQGGAGRAGKGLREVVVGGAGAFVAVVGGRLAFA